MGPRIGTLTPTAVRTPKLPDGSASQYRPSYDSVVILNLWILAVNKPYFEARLRNVRVVCVIILRLFFKNHEREDF